MVLICVLAVVFLAACSSNDEEQPEPTETPHYVEQGETGGEIEQPTIPTPTPEPEPTPAPVARGFERVIFRDGAPYMTHNEQLVVIDGGVPLVVDGVLLVPVETAQLALCNYLVWGVDDSIIIDGITFLPLQTIASELDNVSVGWDAISGTLIVTTGQTVSQASVSRNAMNNQSAAWFGSNESIRIGNILLFFQQASGGWATTPNFNMQPSYENIMLRVENPFGTDGLLDNGNTIPEIRFLVSMYQATGVERFWIGLERGIRGVIASQYDNGGFPQRMARPVTYHGEITFNDHATTDVLSFWLDITVNRQNFPSITGELLELVQESLDRGIQGILDMQIYSEQQGMLTAWAAQHHRETLEPVWGRAFEPPSISGNEGARVVQFLMNIPNPSPEVQHSIHSAVAFFAYTEIIGYRHVEGVPARHPSWGNDRIIVEDANARGLWARFICIDTFEPLFVDRNPPALRINPNESDYYDPIVGGFLPGLHLPLGGNRRAVYNEDGSFNLVESYAALSHERRNGYRYVGNWPNALPAQYQAWLTRNNLTSPN